MTDWRNEIRVCDCSQRFAPKREKQRHCSERCRDIAKKRLKRSGDKTTDPIPVARSGDTPTTNHPQGLGNGPTMVWTERDDKSWPTPTALQGDDYRLEYYEDGYPKLPACPNRRPLVCAEAA